MKTLLLTHPTLVLATTTTFLVVWNIYGGHSYTSGTTYGSMAVHAVSLPSYTNPRTDSSILLDESIYTFEQFLSDFGRSYTDPMEYNVRENIFYKNLHTIVQHNQLQQLGLGRSTTTTTSSSFHGNYWMGINEFADRQANELHRGYDKYQSSTTMQQQRRSRSEERRVGKEC